MATVQRYVNTASTAGGNGTTNATSGANRAYASLSEWEANVSGASTDTYIVDCCGTAADTTAVTVAFSTPITAGGSVTIRANASDPAGKYNGAAAISTAHYRLSPTGSVSSLLIGEGNVTVDGLQIECQGGSFRAALNFSSVPSPFSFTARNNRIRASGTCESGLGTGGTAFATNGTLLFENNLIVGFDSKGIEVRPDNFRTPTVTVRHNTVYGDGSSVAMTVLEGSSAAGAYTIKGNAFANSGGSNCFSISLSAGSVTYDDNATEDAQGTTGEIAIGTLANAWTSPGTGQSADFTVKNISSSLYSVVNPTLVTTDINGYTRDGASHDAGAFELAGASGASITPGVGSLVIGGIAPTVAVTANRVITPGVGAGSFAGVAPTVATTANYALQPAAAGLSIAGLAPTVAVTGNLAIDPALGTLSMAGLAPGVAVTSNVSLTPAVGTLSIAGLAPTVQATANVELQPGAGSATFAGVAPTVAVTGSSEIQPGRGTLSFAGVAPTVQATANIVIQPAAGALSLVGATPSVQSNNSLSTTPGPAALTLAGLSPGVTQTDNRTATPAVGAAAFAGVTPTVLVAFSIAPAVGQATFVGQTPGVTLASLLAPAPGAASFVGLAPTVVRTTAANMTPAVRALALTGKVPQIIVSGTSDFKPGNGDVWLVSRRRRVARPTEGPQW